MAPLDVDGLALRAVDVETRAAPVELALGDGLQRVDLGLPHPHVLIALRLARVVQEPRQRGLRRRLRVGVCHLQLVPFAVEPVGSPADRGQGHHEYLLPGLRREPPDGVVGGRAVGGAASTVAAVAALVAADAGLALVAVAGPGHGRERLRPHPLRPRRLQVCVGVALPLAGDRLVFALLTSGVDAGVVLVAVAEAQGLLKKFLEAAQLAPRGQADELQEADLRGRQLESLPLAERRDLQAHDLLLVALLVELLHDALGPLLVERPVLC
mmetsp:Transcript_27263/g.77064  ORF Transcript_27263/g.77064 Transcript_27263/m.77064 type:complete len:269 (-) Transcript_27263:215-1021(-)